MRRPLVVNIGVDKGFLSLILNCCMFCCGEVINSFSATEEGIHIQFLHSPIYLADIPTKPKNIVLVLLITIVVALYFFAP